MKLVVVCRPPFSLLLGQPSSAFLSTAQAGGPPSVKIGWATKTIIFEDVEAIKRANSFGNLQFWNFFSPCLLGSENYPKFALQDKRLLSSKS